MRRILFLLIALPLVAQTWDLRFEVPFPEGQSLPQTLIKGTTECVVSGNLNTGNGGILSVNHRLIRVGPILRLEWGAEVAQWRANGQVDYSGGSDFRSTLTQTGAGLGINAQLWLPFIGISGEIGAIQRIQYYKFSTDDPDSTYTNRTLSRTWLRVGARWRLPLVPVIHPYIAASYQQPITKDQPLQINSIETLAAYFQTQGKGQEFQRLWTFGVGVTF